MNAHLATGVEGRVSADVGGRPTSCSSTLITHGTSGPIFPWHLAADAQNVPGTAENLAQTNSILSTAVWDRYYYYHSPRFRESVFRGRVPAEGQSAIKSLSWNLNSGSLAPGPSPQPLLSLPL